MAYEGEEEAHAEAVEKRSIPGVCTADGWQDEARKNKQDATARPVAHQGSRPGEMQNTTMPVANTWK